MGLLWFDASVGCSLMWVGAVWFLWFWWFGCLWVLGGFLVAVVLFGLLASGFLWLWWFVFRWWVLWVNGWFLWLSIVVAALLGLVV